MLLENIDFSTWKNKTRKFSDFQAENHGILADPIMSLVVKLERLSQQNCVYEAEPQPLIGIMISLFNNYANY